MSELINYRVSSVIRLFFFLFKTIPKNLDPSSETDLGFWDCLEGKLHLLEDIHWTDLGIFS